MHYCTVTRCEDCSTNTVNTIVCCMLYMHACSVPLALALVPLLPELPRAQR
jgi:hypothetical protein